MKKEGMREYMIEDRADREQARSIDEFYNRQEKAVSFNLGERIKQVREIEKYIDDRQEALDAELEQHHRFVEMGRTEILTFLNQTNQKSANTEYGGCHWKPKVTWRVEDKEAFSRHVIGAEAWQLITWAAQPTNCEAFTTEHKMAPPGLVRNAVNILYITAPVKPKNKNKVVKQASEPTDDQHIQQETLDQENAASLAAGEYDTPEEATLLKPAAE